jgi:hypothetical protein
MGEHKRAVRNSHPSAMVPPHIPSSKFAPLHAHKRHTEVVKPKTQICSCTVPGREGFDGRSWIMMNEHMELWTLDDGLGWQTDSSGTDLDPTNSLGTRTSASPRFCSSGISGVSVLLLTYTYCNWGKKIQVSVDLIRRNRGAVGDSAVLAGN